MRYYLLNPTGNITALIDGNIPAAEVMKKEPACEQAGNIYEKEGCDIALRMSGGEFCGNAAMCAAYLTGKENAKVFVEGTGIVNVTRTGDRFGVEMPRPLEITEKNGFPMVRFPGIDHVITEGDLDPALIKSWCEGDALGFMYLSGDGMKPLVYVKGSGTLFWENSCASGTTAVGEYLGRPVKLKQPGGVLEYADGILTGQVELIKTVEV